MESFNSYLLAKTDQFLKEIHGERTKGRSLPDMGYQYKYVNIYRATPSINDIIFHPMDYVTRSKKFAIEHAEHNTIVNDQKSPVIHTMIKSANVYEAYNPGEYFYDRPEVEGKIIYVADPIIYE